MEVHEILDRYEMLYSDKIPVLSDLRRTIIDEDLSSIFRIATSVSMDKDEVDDLRKSVMEKNPHAMFRVFLFFTAQGSLGTGLIDELRKVLNEKNPRSVFRIFEYIGITSVDDLRKAITEKNHRSVFRLMDHLGATTEDDDLRKAITEKNYRSIFRVFDQYESSENLDDLRKAITEKNHRSIFRVFEHLGLYNYPGLGPAIDNLRKAMTEKNLNAVFRIFEEHKDADLDDIRKTIIEENLHSLFRLLEHFRKTHNNLDIPLEDLRKAIVEDNLRSLFRLIENEDTLPVEDLRKAIVEDNLHSLFRLIEHRISLSEENTDLLNISILVRQASLEDNLHAFFRLLPLVADIVEHTEILDDLRRGIVEDNIHSLFRVLLYFQEVEQLPLSMPVEDLRKAILEDNVYSIFRVLARIDSENREMNSLRQAVVNKEIRNLVSIFTDNEDDVPHLFDTLPKALKHFPESNLEDAFSRGQILSKKWLISELVGLEPELGTVFICAGWYATLASLLFESTLNIEKIRSFDSDENCWQIADAINRPYVLDGWKFKAQTADINNINYAEEHTYITHRYDLEPQELTDTPDTIINTSCEHIENFDNWYSKIPAGKLVVLQTNDDDSIDDHINCSQTLEEFKNSCPMAQELYSGVLNLDRYNRLMVIGYR